MKKITAFFMALFPFLVIGILFATGLITKDFTDKTVQRLEMKQDIVKVQKESYDKMDYNVSNNVRVIPDVVRDPTVFWTTDDATLASVEKETGKVTINELGYGDIKLHATAKTNVAAKADCTLNVWDDKIHKIVVDNAEQAKHMNAGSSLQLQTRTIPSENIKDPTLTYSIKETEQQGNFRVTPTGVVITNASANGKATVVITANNEQVKEEVEINVGDVITAIGFKDDGNTLTTDGTYNLMKDVITAPYHAEALTPISKYFEFTSSDEDQASIDENGVITFNEHYVPFNYVEFSVKCKLGESLIATKKVASSLEYYSNVSFDNYAKTVVCDLSEHHYSLANDVKFTTYPAVGKSSLLSLESSDSDVIAIENNIPYAINEGKATLTVKAKVTSTTEISDKIDVTIISNSLPRILNGESLELTDTHYLPLRKLLLPAYENKDIDWSIEPSAGVAELTSNETINFIKNDTEVTLTASYKENGSVIASDTIDLKCTCNDVTTIELADGSATIAAGDRVKFTLNGSQVVLDDTYTQLKKLDDNSYIALCGTGATALPVTKDTTTLNLIITEPVIGFKATDDWSNYITNAKTVDPSTVFSIYPATATAVTYLTGAPYVPTIKYDLEAEDPSVVTITGTQITFEQPTSVKITATSEDVEKTFNVTSYVGKNGKFSLYQEVTGGTDKQILNGGEITLYPGETINCYIKDFYLKEGSAQTLFTMTSLSGGKIVSTEASYTSEKAWYSITGVQSGTDVVKISNGIFSFYINVKVEPAVSSVDLYCFGNKLTKNTNTDITAYSKTDVILHMDFAPVVAYDEDLTVKFNEATWTVKPGTSLNISNGSQPATGQTIVWKDSGANELSISYTHGTTTTELAKYNIVYSATGPQNFTIDDTFEEGSSLNMYLKAKAEHTVMKINLENSIFNQKDIEEHFDVTGFNNVQKYGNYIIGNIPTAGTPLTVTITPTGGTAKVVNVQQDTVYKIVLPKHNNLEESDAKGLQRVHVFGTESQYANETKSDVYRLPINIYDKDNHEITGAAKATAMATLHTQLEGISEAKYNATKDCMDIKFAKDATNIYTHNEIFNNAFANAETNKNQLFTIGTEYGRHHVTDDSCFAWYSFVVVDGVNVYDQKGIEDIMKLEWNTRKCVLQTNFGIEGEKEVTPFTYTGEFQIDELYGNGYGMNFDSYTKARMEGRGDIFSIYAFNTQFIGCNKETFLQLKTRSCSFTETGANNEENERQIAYCSFTRFFQSTTVCSDESGASEFFVHFKNCMFFNEDEKCRVAMSISNPRCYCTIEDCAFFNSSKIAILSNNGATVRLKGNIDVYNFHGSDLFDALGLDPAISEWAWGFVSPILDAAGLIQGTKYGSLTDVTNAYLVTTGGYVRFYDHTDASGKDIYIESQHGSEKAANYLKYGAGLNVINVHIWTTVIPPLPLQYGHSPAYSDEFSVDAQGHPHLNTDVRNLLYLKITRW